MLKKSENFSEINLIPNRGVDPTDRYLLVYHGSPDPRPQQGAIALSQHLAEVLRSLDGNDAQVGIASLECHPEPLHQQIIEFAQTQSCSRVVLIPLFLLPGRHLMEDIPAEVALAQATLGTDCAIVQAPHLGGHPSLRRLLTEEMAAQPMEAWIFLAHGSRRSGGNAAIEQLADYLGAITAYWANPPSLDDRLQELIQSEVRKIGIVQFFLFAGHTTDAIAQQVTQTCGEFPALEVYITSPLVHYSGLANVLLNLAKL